MSANQSQRTAYTNVHTSINYLVIRSQLPPSPRGCFRSTYDQSRASARKFRSCPSARSLPYSARIRTATPSKPYIPHHLNRSVYECPSIVTFVCFMRWKSPPPWLGIRFEHIRPISDVDGCRRSRANVFKEETDKSDAYVPENSFDQRLLLLYFSL